MVVYSSCECIWLCYMGCQLGVAWWVEPCPCPRPEPAKPLGCQSRVREPNHLAMGQPLMCFFFFFWGTLVLSWHLLPILLFLFLLRKPGPELTSVPIFLYFICGMPATAWLDKRCIGPHLGSELVNPGPPK